MTISEQENELFMEWQDHLKSRLDKDIVDNLFCLDGLHFTGTPFIDNFGNWQMKRDYKEEELWRNSKIKCLFLTKDHNLQGDSEGVDIRFETGLKNMSGNSVDTAKIYHSFYGRYFLLLRGILSLNNNIIPESRPEYINKARENAKFFWESPVCRINLKK